MDLVEQAKNLSKVRKVKISTEEEGMLVISVIKGEISPASAGTVLNRSGSNFSHFAFRTIRQLYKEGRITFNS
jgi:hypothetical protein